MKPTPAQLRWLLAIDKGIVKRVGHSWVNSMVCSALYPARSNYVMTCALHDAGWIDQEPAPVEYGNHYRLVLTQAGREAAGLPTKGTQAEDGPFYIASIKHTTRHHAHITFWGPDYRGYRLAINDDTIGRYTAEYIAADSYHLSDGVSCLAVPESVVKSMLSPTPYFASNGRAQRFYDTPGPVVDNTRENWNKLIAAAFALPPGVKPKPEWFRGKPVAFSLPVEA